LVAVIAEKQGSWGGCWTFEHLKILSLLAELQYLEETTNSQRVDYEPVSKTMVV
jgi:hypothetical protein